MKKSLLFYGKIDFNNVSINAHSIKDKIPKDFIQLDFTKKKIFILVGSIHGNWINDKKFTQNLVNIEHWVKEVRFTKLA